MAERNLVTYENAIKLAKLGYNEECKQGLLDALEWLQYHYKVVANVAYSMFYKKFYITLYDSESNTLYDTIRNEEWQYIENRIDAMQWAVSKACDYLLSEQEKQCITD